MIILQLNNEVMDWNLIYAKKNGKDNYIVYENGIGKKVVGPKLKLWTCFWGQGECEWTLV